MAIRFRQVLNRVRPGREPTDAELLGRFSLDRNEEAFAELVRRHGPMVFGVCRRMLGNWQDAEDAFQATFLVLACKPDAPRPAARLGAWLHGVACHVALRARRTAARRSATEARAAAEHPRPVETSDPPPDDVRGVLDEALLGLPEKYRAAVVLCDLEGLSRKDAADRLGWTEGTLSGRLARARQLLADRLTRRGVALAAGAVGVVLSAQAAPAAVAGELPASTVTTAALVGGGLSGLPTGPAAALPHGVTRAMFLHRLKLTAAGLIGAGLLAAGLGTVLARSTAPPADPQPVVRLEPMPLPAAAARPAPAPKPDPPWRVKRTFEHSAAVNAVAFGPAAVYAGGADGQVVGWDLRTGKGVVRGLAPGDVGPALPVDWVGLNPDATWLFFVSGDRQALSGVNLREQGRPGVGVPGARFLGYSADAKLCLYTSSGAAGRLTLLPNRLPENLFGGPAVATWSTTPTWSTRRCRSTARSWPRPPPTARHMPGTYRRRRSSGRARRRAWSRQGWPSPPERPWLPWLGATARSGCSTGGRGGSRRSWRVTPGP